VIADTFVDTGVWYAAANRNDADHERCAEVLMEHAARRVPLVTTNLVLAETHALLLRWVNRFTALGFLRAIRRPGLAVVESTAEREARALSEWLERYDDQEFSLTDGVSFVVMTERGIGEALTLDNHFSAAGFHVSPGVARKR
jgi:uncharacterized protein